MSGHRAHNQLPKFFFFTLAFNSKANNMIKIKVLAVLAASLTLLLVLTIGESVAVEEEALGQGDATTSNVRPKSRLDKLMDWETYTVSLGPSCKSSAPCRAEL